MNISEHDQMMRCRDFVLAALRKEMEHRFDDHFWLERERSAVAVASNAFAEANGFEARLTVTDVERIEGPAVGHVDYARKLALYIAEAITQSGRSDG